MFPKHKRLTRSTFASAAAAGRRRSSAHFSAVVSETASGYAVVVSKKTARLAVTRHRLKRRVRAALRNLPIPLPRSVILYPRASALLMRYDDLIRELTKLLS